MFPDLFSIGPLTVHAYGVSIALGFAVALALTVRLARSCSIPYRQVVDMAFIGVFWGIIGSRFFFLLMHPAYYLNHPWEALKVWEGGLVFSGGILTVAGAMLFYSRREHLSFWRIGDLWAPGAALGQGIGSVGCFMAGCCYGKPLEGGWGVVFTDPHSLAPLNVALYPTQLFSAFGGFLISGILLVLGKRKGFQGRVLIWFLILHSTARLVVERFRADDRGLIPGTEMTLTQLIALVVLFGSVVAFFLRSRGEAKSSQSAP